MTATLGMILLGFQLVVTFLCALAIIGLRLVPMELGLWTGGILLVLQVAAILVLVRTGSPILGWIIEVLCVAAGFVHPAMFVVGGMFLAAWIYCMVQGRRVDRLRAPIIREYERKIAAGEIDPDAPVGSFDLEGPETGRL